MSIAPTRPAPVAPNRPAPGDARSRNNGRPAPQPRVSFGTIAEGTGHRMVLYGPGGIGKTTLAATAPGPVAFFDLDDSLPRLRASFSEGGLKLDVRPVAIPSHTTFCGSIRETTPRFDQAASSST